MANVFDVANFFIDIAVQDEEDTITNLKLNKLLYFAQGQHLALTGNPIFSDPIEVWTYGPVVSSIYHKYKVCGHGPISFLDDNYSANKFTPEEYEVLLDVAREYGKYIASYLVSKTHAIGSPWANAMERGASVISTDEIKDFFIRNEQVPSFSRLLNSKPLHFIGNRDCTGALVLPAEEDEDWDECDEM